MSSSELSSLSSLPSTDNEDDVNLTARDGNLEHFLKNGTDSNTDATGRPPTQRKRPASPPHEYVLADNADIAVCPHSLCCVSSETHYALWDLFALLEANPLVAQFITMFRSRFSDVFPKSLPHYGPQDIEKGVVDSVPGEQVERLLCALLGLVLNRKKDVERGHFQRALEEAVHAHESQWPSAWNFVNPLHGGRNFNTMDPAQRLTLLKALILWSLHSSEAVLAVIKESYKQQRHDDDLNQPLSVQPWGRDGDKRRYWLVEGQDDTHFRLYRESNPVLKHNTWRSVAGSIDELKGVAEQLGEEGSQAARRLKERILLAMPRFEASEEKRKRRDYRNSRKAQFIRPEPGFSLYEGRTRGKRMRYTYSDDEEEGSDVTSNRRSTRNSGVSTPAEPSGPTFTASGRQIISRVHGAYGETVLSDRATSRVSRVADGPDGANDTQEQTLVNGRSRRSGLREEVNGWPKSGEHIAGYNSVDEMESESSEGGWNGGDDDDEVDEPVIDDDEAGDEDMSEGDSIADDTGIEHTAGRSLVVQLRYHKKRGPQTNCIAERPDSPDPSSQPSPIVSQPKEEIITNGHATLSTSNMKMVATATPPAYHEAPKVLPSPFSQDHALPKALPFGIEHQHKGPQLPLNLRQA
ncbi:MAG: hypothetical protein M1830_004913 [Pleopsidium flavum]|nr:MAG: hypothetical protein M1830_004913 [Pleopsidium flavum]